MAAWQPDFEPIYLDVHIRLRGLPRLCHVCWLAMW